MTEARPRRTRDWFERIVWLAYWLAFAVLAIRGGFQPGLVSRPHLQPYPWLDVVWTATLLGLITLALRRILRLDLPWSWSRWAIATILAAVFALWTVAMVATDLPGYVYVAPVYAIVTAVVLVACGLAMLVRKYIPLLKGQSGRAA